MPEDENPPAPDADKKDQDPPADDKKDDPPKDDAKDEKADEDSPLVPMPKMEVPDFSPADEGDDFRSWASEEN